MAGAARVRLSLLLICFAGFLGPAPARAVILFGGGVGRDTTAPTGTFAGSGWQYEGAWEAGVGTPIAPHWFLSARHLGGSPGDSLVVHGVSYTTTGFVDDPAGTDLRLWQISGTFDQYASLYTKLDEVSANKLVTIFGRGTDQGAAVDGPNGAQGYAWGASDGQLSWGANRVSFITTAGGGPAGDFLGTIFSTTPAPGVPTSATLSAGDSGGGMFIRDTDGVWKLAAVNYSVDGPYSLAPDSGYSNAAMYDQRGFYVGSPTSYSYVPNDPGGSVGQGAYASRIATELPFLYGVTGVPEPNSLALITVGIALVAATRARRRGRSSRRI